MPNDMSREVLETLRQVHERMKQRMMAHPEYCAMVALEKSIDSISEILEPSEPLVTPASAADEVTQPTDQEIENAIAQTVATKVAPITPAAPPAPQPSRISQPAFLPMQRMGHAVGMR